MIKRAIYTRLQQHLKEKEITLIVGARQVGKTTMMLQLEQELKKKGERTLFLSLDLDMDQAHFVSQQALVSHIKLSLGDSRGYVFIDEIQRKTNAGIFIKGIYDLGLPYKFILSGSGSLELKENIHESLSGRKLIFEVTPVTFAELVSYRTNYEYEDRLSDYYRIESIPMNMYLLEYLNFGGYPRVISQSTREGKLRVLDELFQSYLERDVASLLRVENYENYRTLVRMLSGQIGQLLNVADLARGAGLSEQTVKKYLVFLEKTFITERITPFTGNVTSEIVKSPICYFVDIGLRNFARRESGDVAYAPDIGFIFENLVHQILKAQLAFSLPLHFWRTKDGAEVDFIIRHGNEIVPLEVKYSALKKAVVGKSLHSFISKYSPRVAYVVNKSLDTEITVEKTAIRFIPWWKLLVDKI